MASEPKTATTKAATSDSVETIDEPATSASPAIIESTPILEDTAEPSALSTLQSLFPDTDEEVLRAVLENHHGSMEEATDTLLGMNDPNFKLDTHVSNFHGHPRAMGSGASRPHTYKLTTKAFFTFSLGSEQQTQLQSDAQLAQMLAYEEDQAQQRRRANARTLQREAAGGELSGALPYTPYVPKRSRTNPTSVTGNSSGEAESRMNFAETGERDELDQLQEQFSKLAEQGKKTFGNFLGKAKGFADTINEKINASASPSVPGDVSDNKPIPPPKTSSASTSPSSTQPSSIVPERLPRPPAASTARIDAVPARSASLLTSSSALASTQSPAPPSAGSTEDESVKKSDLSKIEGLLLPRQSVALKKNDHEADDDDDDDLEYVRSPFDDD